MISRKGLGLAALFVFRGLSLLALLVADQRKARNLAHQFRVLPKQVFKVLSGRARMFPCDEFGTRGWNSP